MKYDLISVIIPVYNNENYFERCIKSVIEQTYFNTEIIIINDCSIDNVENIILKYKELDKRIKYYKNTKNEGVGYTRNLGISKSQGKYLYFLDSDDYIEKNCLEVLHSNINEDNSFSCMLKGFKEVNGIRNNTQRTKEELDLLQSPSVDIRLFNKSVIVDNNISFSNLKIAEDLEFIFKVILINNSVSYVDEALYTYVVHSDSSLQSNTQNQLDTLIAMDSIIDFAKKKEIFDEFKEKIEFAAINHILIGTTNRLMRRPNFNNEDIRKCTKYINDNFPLWAENKYVKKYFLQNIEIIKKINNLKKYGLNK